MKATYIPYAQLSIFSNLIQDYLSENPVLKSFTKYSTDLSGFTEKIKQFKFKGNRNTLAQVLEKQYQHITTSEKTQQNIQNLLSEHTFTVTTGHQLNIFTGPLYFIFKIASTIKLCQNLKVQFPNKNFVPIYWMATEDHDFEEINHTFVKDKKISWHLDAYGATGALPIASIEKSLQEYCAFMGISKYAPQLTKIVQNAYLKNNCLADATRAMVNELFADYGLVIIDANTTDLKKIFAPVMQQDILEQNSFKHISHSNEQLSNLGYKIQVQPREINFFYLDENLRERIIFENNQYKVLNTQLQFSADELCTALQTSPEKFSPNVVMRPLYQEMILPNLTYIGGAGEIAYWLQLKANFDSYQIDFPILLVRNSAMWMDEISIHYQQKLNISLEELFLNTNNLQRNFVERNAQHQLDLSSQKKQIEAILQSVETQAKQVDFNLESSSQSLQTKIEHLLEKFENKILKAEKRHHDDALRQIEKLKQRVFPNGGLQERKENFAVIYKDFGPQFIDFVIQAFKPLQKEFTFLLAKHESNL